MTIHGWDALAAHIRAHPIEGSPEARREAFDRLTPLGPAGTARMIGDVRCVMFGAVDDDRPIIWVHGGGLVFGSPRSHAAAAMAVARRTGRGVIMPDYRLAPEHRWPAPLDDVVAVVDALTGPVDLVGDSAGGHIALIAALRRPRRVRRLALISPNTDRTGLSETRRAHSSTDLMNDDADDRDLAAMSFGPDLADQAEASPLLMDLAGLPPVWLTAATDEVLLDDSLMLARRLALADVPVDLRVWAGLCHLWILWPDALSESVGAYDDLARFLGRAD